MTIALAILGFAFAAFCVWLAVRIVNRREQWGKRTAFGVAVGIPLSYVLGFGVTCWATSVQLNGRVKPRPEMAMYWPLGALAANRAASSGAVVRGYMRLWIPAGACVLIQTNARGSFTAIFNDD
jgi:hypothetical protein